MAKNLKSRWIEFVLLYLAVPPVLTATLPRGGLIPALWVAGILAAIILKRTEKEVQEFRSPEVQNIPLLRRGARRVGWFPSLYPLAPLLLRFLILATVLTAALWMYRPELLFQFPRKDTPLWCLIMVCYPVVSVFPQALVYRKLYERRYAPLFASPSVSWVVGALIFSWAHLPFRNPVALLFTFFGGLMFLATYRKSHPAGMTDHPSFRKTLRLLPSIIEHALYGDFIFTVGWGIYLLHGTVALLK